MAFYLRKLVSGSKARFHDEKLGINLDLVYLNDRVIIMGYPAKGVEAFYRNAAEDAQKFLDSRHGEDFWVFNLCPLTENSYPASLFGGRVSRYPFPDHHAPPLAVIALATREMIRWLQESPAHVIVLHCKAGKGRSGTLACALLLALSEQPLSPQLQRSYSTKEWVKRQAMARRQVTEAEETIDVDPQETPSTGDGDNTLASGEAKLRTSTDDAARVAAEVGAEEGKRTIRIPPGKNTTKSSPEKTLENVLALHTSRRMKANGGHRGVSIPSQRRFLYYWSLFLAGSAPPGFWSTPYPNIDQASKSAQVDDSPKVRLKKIRVRMQDGSATKMAALKVIHSVLDRTMGQVKDKGEGDMWISLARYDDAMVQQFEEWEKKTRTAVPPQDAEPLVQEEIQSGRWDKGKMVRSFARFGELEDKAETEKTEHGQLFRHTLYPLPFSQWIHVSPEQAGTDASSASFEQVDGDQDEDNEGVIVEASRELRAKLYIGQVFIGWFWFIPTFHMDQPRSDTPTKFVLSKSEVDFPLGMGAWIYDIEVTMTWVSETRATAGPHTDTKGVPPRQTSAESEAGKGGEPDDGKGFAAALAGGDTLHDAIRAQQASKE